ncbi:unnamed protein product [Rangifer tarandus platyrhynchus]|uniref:Secreted protein n=2 Tax=Rangifer tarandus platyrhynchus TaxID=3082113 RepID=A0ABN8Z561_RANTA|nr:unnamed protein product [Rangifer tarandus platyrhynchus]
MGLPRWLLLLLLSRFSRVRLCATPQTAAHQAPPPRDSPGKNTGAGSHFLLQRMEVKVKSLRRVRVLAAPWTPGSSVHGVVQARVVSQVALVVKNPPANAGDARDVSSIPGRQNIPWSRKWHPTPVFLPGKPH